MSLSVALLAKSAFPGNSAWLGTAVLQPVVLGEGDLPANPYGEAVLGTEGTWGRALAGSPHVAGSTWTCVKDGVIWVDDALLEHVTLRFVIPNGDRSGC